MAADILLYSPNYVPVEMGLTWNPAGCVPAKTGTSPAPSSSSSTKVMITEEPMGGSAKPTGRMLAEVRLSTP